MFSRLLHSSAAFLFPYNTSKELASSFQVDQQIEIELKQAAEQGMVSTRSQDSTPAGDASHTSKQLYPQVVVLAKKRKAGDGAKESPAQPVTKRRRRSAKSNGDIAPSSRASKRKPGRPRKRASAKTANGDATNSLNHSESDQAPSTQGSRPTSSQMPGSTADQTIDDGREEKAIEPAIKKPKHTLSSDDEVLEAHDQAKPDAGSATGSRKGKTPKKRKRDLEGVTGVDENRADFSASDNKPERSFTIAAKATHKRFGSEDIEVSGPIPSSGIEEQERIQKDISEDEDESGDEAPETVTASAGFDKARTAALEAAKVATRQEAEKKLKRREHDQRLRLQAETAKNFRSKDKPPTKSQRTTESLAEAIGADGQMPVVEPEDEGPKPPAKTRFFGKTPLPLLLPEEILAAKPVVHAATPPFSNRKLAVSQKRKFLDFEPKPPKDIKRGNVNVRVLQDNRSILPPKSSQASKALRESWLTGRRGFKGEIGVPRRKPSGGFVRSKQ